MRRRAAPPNRRRRRRAGTSGSSARRGAGPAPRRGRRTNSRETSRETADRARTGVDPCKSIFMNDDAAGIGGRLLTAHSHSVRASFDARLFALRAWRGSVARRAQRASVRSLHAHTAPPSHTESIGIHRARSAAFLHGAPLALREHTCGVCHCLSHDCDFFRVPFRSRAPPPTSTPPSPPSPRASPPRDCPILRP